MAWRHAVGGTWRDRFALVSLAACAALAVPLAAGYFGAVHRALDSPSHFRAHLAVALGVAALPLLFTSRLKLGALAIAIAVLAFATTSGSVPVPGLGVAYGPLRAIPADRPVYRLLQQNLRFNNPEPEKVLSMIGRIRPDVVTLDEVTDAWRAKLDLMAGAYPFRVYCPHPDNIWSVAILSRRPYGLGSEPVCDPRGAMAIAKINFGGRTADVVALHLAWPWPREQAWQIEGLAPMMRSVGETAVLGGDFNAVPWSHAVRQVARLTGMTLMPSPGATWLWRRLPRSLASIGLPIDNLLAKGEVDVHQVTRLDAAGSDHFPVLMRFSFAPPRAPPPAPQTASVETD